MSPCEPLAVALKLDLENTMCGFEKNILVV